MTSGGISIGGPGYGNYEQTALQHVNTGDLVAMQLTNTSSGNTYWGLAEANETVAGNQDFTFIGQAGFTAPCQINWFTNGTDTFIQLNTNADPTVDAVIQLNGIHTIDASLFFL